MSINKTNQLQFSASVFKNLGIELILYTCEPSKLMMIVFER